MANRLRSNMILGYLFSIKLLPRDIMSCTMDQRSFAAVYPNIRIHQQS
ncbi:10307_t:CDS:2 [Acaulospora colombiana]|uniref:10307_t:CDS:1 n=1 Tax=Acaulospora colombiana TaxID=27376 RepID=A0ACA9LJC0_9GLOM|nr:10307_t:CDS:2 [Acaulospora colombiana]